MTAEEVKAREVVTSWKPSMSWMESAGVGGGPTTKNLGGLTEGKLIPYQIRGTLQSMLTSESLCDLIGTETLRGVQEMIDQRKGNLDVIKALSGPVYLEQSTSFMLRVLVYIMVNHGVKTEADMHTWLTTRLPKQEYGSLKEKHRAEMWDMLQKHVASGNAKTQQVVGTIASGVFQQAVQDTLGDMCKRGTTELQNLFLVAMINMECATADETTGKRVPASEDAARKWLEDKIPADANSSAVRRRIDLVVDLFKKEQADAAAEAGDKANANAETHDAIVTLMKSKWDTTQATALLHIQDMVMAHSMITKKVGPTADDAKVWLRSEGVDESRIDHIAKIFIAHCDKKNNSVQQHVENAVSRFASATHGTASNRLYSMVFMQLMTLQNVKTREDANAWLEAHIKSSAGEADAATNNETRKRVDAILGLWQEHVEASPAARDLNVLTTELVNTLLKRTQRGVVKGVVAASLVHVIMMLTMQSVYMRFVF